MTTKGRRPWRLDTDAICAAYANGATVAEMAKMFNCNKCTIREHLAKMGIRPAPPPPRDPLSRLMGYVEKADNGCWIWTGCRSPNGYGRVGLQGRFIGAHVAMFILTKGPVPDGHEIDHQCHNRDLTCPGGDPCQHRACVNPDHLEPATKSENRQRAMHRVTHCPRGHEYTLENTRWDRGTRRCRTCGRAASAASQRVRRAQLKGRVALSLAEARANKIESILKCLDEAKIPLGWSAQRARLAIQHLGATASTDVWHEALRIRRGLTR